MCVKNKCFFSLRNKTDNSVCDFCTLLSHFLLFLNPIFKFESPVTNLTIYPLGTQADSKSPREERSHQPPHPVLAGGQLPPKGRRPRPLPRVGGGFAEVAELPEFQLRSHLSKLQLEQLVVTGHEAGVLHIPLQTERGLWINNCAPLNYHIQQ